VSAATPRVTQLGYLGFEVKDLGAWERFTTEVLGLVVSRRDPSGAFSLRADGYAQRIFITPGEADDLAFAGWQVDDETALAAVSERVTARGLPVTRASAELAAARTVGGLATFVDPGGVPTELFFGPERAAEAFRSPVVRSGFVCGEGGLGHLVLSANDQAESMRFYEEALGFRLSDRIVADVFGYKADIAFMHANPRHHSVAFGQRQKKRLHHFMLEVGSIDEVGLALDRTLKAGLRIMQTLGRHPNDRMLSFYAKTPSGFQFELGWGARTIDDETWQPTQYDQVSEWGHLPPEFVVPRKEERR
jgi:2,3-dihydroxybiphenyl 1,2-dioxygenase